jgi:hypothetical protein
MGRDFRRLEHAMSGLRWIGIFSRIGRCWAGAALGMSLLGAASARGEIVPTAVFGPGKSITRAECAALPQAVWVSALKRTFCMRYYLSTAGGEGSRPVVFLQGDFLDTKDENTDDLTKYADRISKNTKTTGIYLARVGRDGSSGSHDLRHSVLELEATNAALEAIKQKYGFSGFHIYGHSGGAMLVGGLLRLRTDIACAVPADGRLQGTRKANLPDPALRDFNLVDSIPIIARNRSARILVVTDPQDKDITVDEQTPFVEKLRAVGGQVEQFLVDSGSYDAAFHHFTTPHAEVVIRDCIRGASREEITADLAELVANHVAAKAKAEANVVVGTPSIGSLLNGINLLGADYSNFRIESAEPGPCQNACRSDAKCVAWTFVQPGAPGNQARCWLKDRVPQQIRSTCCVSGVERAEDKTGKRD